MFRIVHIRQLSDAVFEMGVEAPRIARKARAGQFLMLADDGSGERIPLTFSDWSAEEGWIRFIFMRVGKTTHELSHLEVGDELADVVGPLGVPTHVEELGRVAVVGGGVGAAVAYPVARAMAAAGSDVNVILGARNADLLILEDEFRALPLRDAHRDDRRRLGGRQGPRDRTAQGAVRRRRRSTTPWRSARRS